ncbi:tRNA-dihydrouridine synthase family protein [Bdellovibrionota bacterium FG-1]
MFTLHKDKPTFILAPMEGVFDAPMRAVFAEVGGFDFSVSEFIRVSAGVIGGKTILEFVPELAGLKLGEAVLPVQVQLLGCSPELLAQTALEACVVGARAIDLNFGCPSATVNRHNGGAAVLKDPLLIRRIVEQVRRVVPAQIPVSAKIRLGWESPDEVFAVARAVGDGGASWLVIHARTRAQMYKRGVNWEVVRKASEVAKIPVVANGDIFRVEDFEESRLKSGCSHFMLGRGIMRDPLLARRCRAPQSSDLVTPLAAMLGAITRFIELMEPRAQNSGYVPCRVKQWVRFVRVIDESFIPRELMTAVARAKGAVEILAVLGAYVGACDG